MGLLDDKALGQAVPSEAEAHLATCKACRAQLERTRATLSMINEELRATGSINASEEFIERVASELEAANRPSVWTRGAN